MKHHRATKGDIRRLLLTDVISELHIRSRGTYGRRRIRAALAIERDLIVNMKLIVKIMQDLQIGGLPRQKKGKRNLVNVATYEDRVSRDFQAVESNSVWLTDITEHPTPWIPVVVATLDFEGKLQWRRRIGRGVLRIFNTKPRSERSSLSV